jgi:hypothetical protein
VKPTIVAGVNALGRSSDREALTQFLMTIAQTMGPEQMMTFINPDEVIKRLAASQGIDVLNLVRSMQEVQQERASAQQQAMQLEQDKLQVQGMKTPMADPSKNPALAESLAGPPMGGPPQEG